MLLLNVLFTRDIEFNRLEVFGLLSWSAREGFFEMNVLDDDGFIMFADCVELSLFARELEGGAEI